MKKSDRAIGVVQLEIQIAQSILQTSPDRFQIVGQQHHIVELAFLVFGAVL